MTTGLYDTLAPEQDDKRDPIKPLFAVEKGDATSKWVKNAFESLMKQNAPYFEEIKEHLKLYKGQVFDKPKSSANSRLTSEDSTALFDKARNTKLYVNWIHDLVEYRVNTHNAAKPGLDIGPANTSYEDRIAAKLATSVIDSINYQQDEDEVEREMFRHAFICGEHYVAALWNPDIGDLHPDYVKALEGAAGDADNVYVTNSSGEKVKYKGQVRLGDVEYKHFPAWKVLPEPVESYKKVTWHMTWDTYYNEDLKKRYPKKKDLIRPLNTASLEGFDDNYISKLREEDQNILLVIYAKRTKYLPQGRYIVSTVDGDILEDRDLPYQHDENCLNRFSDLDFPGELRARSFLKNIKGLQYHDFFLTSLAAANQKLFCHPKWSVEAGAINIKDLANTRTVVQRRPGSAPPALIQPNPTSPEVFRQIQQNRDIMSAFVKGQFASPNALPARIDSKAALQFLDDKDDLRNNVTFSKANKFRIMLTTQALSVAGEYYTVDDKRLLRIVGKNHEFEIKYFDMANFNRPFDIRVETGSVIPTSGTARMRAIVELAKELPEGTLSSQQIMDLLDLKSMEKLYDITTKALRAAESIIEDLLSGKPVPEPRGYEDLITYWNTFANYIQDRTFKDSIPEQDRQNVLDYLMAVEMLIFQKAQTSPAFAQQVAMLTLYPLVFTLPTPPLPPELDPNQQAITAQQLQAGAAPQDGQQPQAQPTPQDLHSEEVHAASDLVQNSVGTEHIQ